MDRGGSSDQHTHSTHDFAKENRNAQLQTSADSSAHSNMLAPPQQHHPSAPPPGRLQVSSFLPSSSELPWRSAALNAFHLRAPSSSSSSFRHAQDTEPWRGSSGFGLANLLNRPSAASSAPGPAPSSSSSAPALPKFSLPSLHTFGKPFQPELAAGSQHSILNAQSASPPAAPRALAIHTSDPATVDRKPPATQSSSTPSSPSKQQHTTPRKQQDSSKANNNNNNSARRIAPAPADDEDNEPEDDLGGSIRGGRWTADEHERFLAGFRIHGHKWKRVQQVVRTRSVTQVRTHAQKYLLKIAKLKAEKKQNSKDSASGSDPFVAGRTGDSSSDAEQGSHTAPSSPDQQQRLKRYAPDAIAHDSVAVASPGRTPSKKKKAKTRHYSEQRVDILDQEYIAAAATTLCFLMTQKIDSLFDSRTDVEADLLEPYDCYADVAARGAIAPGAQSTALSSGSSAAGASTESRTRAYMHFLTESPVRHSNS